MSLTAMTIDATLLIVVSLSMFVLLNEDEFFEPMVARLLGMAVGMAAFSQAMWLLGVWVPGASGFPLPRIGFDATIAGVCVFRAYSVSWKQTVRRRHERAERMMARAR